MRSPQPEDEPRVDEIASLPDEVAPPPALERRVVAALRERGLLTPRGAAARRLAAVAAACLLAFLAGWIARALARSGEGPDLDDRRPRFLLLLSEPAEHAAPAPEELAARVAEYRAWALDLERGGWLVTADRLEPRSVPLGAGPGATAARPPGEAPAVSGFFLLRARDLDHALALARTCPHLRHGGEVTVRPIARGP